MARNGAVVPPVGIGFVSANSRLRRDSQLDPIIRRVDQILLRTEVPLGRLNRGVAQQQLDLFQCAAGRAAHLRAAAPQIMRGDSLDKPAASA